MDFDSIRDAHDKGLIGFEDWLEKAIRQHPQKITIALARTEPIRFHKLDLLDFAIMERDRNN